jgi:hypothetical protein
MGVWSGVGAVGVRTASGVGIALAGHDVEGDIGGVIPE